MLIIYNINLQPMSFNLDSLFEQTFIQESIPDFIRKVFLLLETGSHPQIICWSEDGKTIVIKDPYRLSKEILPQVFNQNTMRSFIRQLNMYNFKKIRRRDSENEIYFMNPHMTRGNIQELVFIKRKKRGYVEQETLENKEADNIHEKYNIFVFGILTKLSKLLGVSKKNTLLPSELPRFMKDVLEFCNEKIEITTHIEDYGKRECFNLPCCDYQGQILGNQEVQQSLNQIPLFESSLSLLEELYF